MGGGKRARTGIAAAVLCGAALVACRAAPGEAVPQVGARLALTTTRSIYGNPLYRL